MKKKTTKKVTKKVAKKTTKKATKKPVKKIAKKIVKKKTTPKTKKAVKKAVAPKAKKVQKKESASVIKSVTPQIGDVAPQFSLQDQHGNTVSLSDFKGRNVVVYFYPKAMTPGCTVQACSLRDAIAELNTLDIVVLGISADPVNKLRQFEEKEKLNFTLLSDADHKVTEAYGSWGLKKFMGREFMGIMRQSFLVDKAGKIAHVMHKVDTNSHHQDILNFFKHH